MNLHSSKIRSAFFLAVCATFVASGVIFVAQLNRNAVRETGTYSAGRNELTVDAIVVDDQNSWASRLQKFKIGNHDFPDARKNSFSPQSIDYEGGRVIRNSNPPHQVTVIISIKPQLFNADDLRKLASHLKNDFPHAPILWVEILDDPEIANNYVPAGATYRLFYKHRRAFYSLNRKTGREYIEFSSKRGNPVNETRIILSPKRTTGDSGVGSKMRNTAASGQKKPRNLSQYDNGGSYTLPLMSENAIRTQDEAAVRGFIWEHWRQQRRGTISLTAYSRHGEPSVSTFFVEPDVNGKWNVAVEIKRTLVDRRRGAKNHFSQQTEYEAYFIDRIEIPNDGLTPRTIIPEGETRSPATYMLSLKDRRGQFLVEM